MNTPPNRPTVPRPVTPRAVDAQDPARLQSMIRLRRELSELHAGLEYVRLMLKLGVGKS